MVNSPEFTFHLHCLLTVIIYDNAYNHALFKGVVGTNFFFSGKGQIYKLLLASVCAEISLSHHPLLQLLYHCHK